MNSYIKFNRSNQDKCEFSHNGSAFRVIALRTVYFLKKYAFSRQM